MLRQPRTRPDARPAKLDWTLFSVDVGASSRFAPLARSSLEKLLRTRSKVPISRLGTQPQRMLAWAAEHLRLEVSEAELDELLASDVENKQARVHALGIAKSNKARKTRDEQDMWAMCKQTQFQQVRDWSTGKSVRIIASWTWWDQGDCRQDAHQELSGHILEWNPLDSMANMVVVCDDQFIHDQHFPLRTLTFPLCLDNKAIGTLFGRAIESDSNRHQYNLSIK